MTINVLVACEESTVVREEFQCLGFNAWSCDVLPPRGRFANHLQGDVRWALEGRIHKFPDAIDRRTGSRPMFLKWDLMLAFPPCTYLSSSGLHWNRNPKSERFGGRQTEEALQFVRDLLAAPIEHIALENPRGCIGTRIRKADQVIQPHEFGDDASKETHFWLKKLPRLVADPKLRYPGRIVSWQGKTAERWANQTDSGQNRLGPSETRAQERSETCPGIARAMAEQWGRYVWLHG